MILESDFTEDQRQLYELMSEISEECWCAGWINGNEYAIWEAMQNGCYQFGMRIIDKDLLGKVRELSGRIGGWIIWYDDEDDPQLCPKDWGPRFVKIENWHEISGAKL